MAWCELGCDCGGPARLVFGCWGEEYGGRCQSTAREHHEVRVQYAEHPPGTAFCHPRRGPKLGGIRTDKPAVQAAFTSAPADAHHAAQRPGTTGTTVDFVEQKDQQAGQDAERG